MIKKTISVLTIIALALTMSVSSAAAAQNVPHWVLSDYVLWELLDYMDNGSGYIAYYDAAQGSVVNPHINLDISGGKTHIYFNRELPKTANPAYAYIPYTPKASGKITGDRSNGGGFTENDPLTIGAYGELANSDIYFNYSMIPASDIAIFKKFVETHATVMHLEPTYTNVIGAPPNPATTSVYSQADEFLQDISSNHTKLELIVGKGATLKLSKPIWLKSLALTEGATLDLSGMDVKDLSGIKVTSIGADNATVILPKNTDTAKENAFVKKYSLHKANVTVVIAS